MALGGLFRSVVSRRSFLAERDGGGGECEAAERDGGGGESAAAERDGGGERAAAALAEQHRLRERLISWLTSVENGHAAVKQE